MTDRELAGCALSDVLALLEKATPGEWAHTPHYGWNIASDTFSPTSRTAGSIGTAIWPHDAQAIAAAVNFLRQYGPELLSRAPSRDAERLDWMAHHSVSIRQDYRDEWFLLGAYHMKNPVVDDRKRFGSAREAIDAAIAAAEGETK